MSNAAKSILFFGIYLVVAGSTLVFLPNLLLLLIKLPPTHEVWIRIVGLLSAIIGGYYIHAAKYNFVPFYWSTVFGRATFALGIIVFVLLRFAAPILLIFSVIDIIGALVTLTSLRKSS